jgi:large subunit ribosomal protein L3
MRAAGHMGSDTVTVRNLVVVRVDAGNNLLVVRGSVPGAGGSYLVIQKG